MKPTILQSCLLAFVATGANAQSPSSWSYHVNSQGARSIELSGSISTPSGSKSAQIKFVRSTGPKVYWSFDLVIESVSTIKGFTFDDFEGPDSKASGELLILETIGTPKPTRFSFCPAGGYVSQPKDGFNFSALRTGPSNPLLNLVRSASQGKGQLSVRLRDFKNPGVFMQATYDLAGSEQAFTQFLASK